MLALSLRGAERRSNLDPGAHCPTRLLRGVYPRAAQSADPWARNDSHSIGFDQPDLVSAARRFRCRQHQGFAQLHDVRDAVVVNDFEAGQLAALDIGIDLPRPTHPMAETRDGDFQDVAPPVIIDAKQRDPFRRDLIAQSEATSISARLPSNPFETLSKKACHSDLSSLRIVIGSPSGSPNLCKFA